MAESELEAAVMADIEPVARGMGFEIVELRALRTKSGVRVYLVIYAREGVSLDSCAEVLKTVRPRLQMLSGDADVYIEVSSPGLERVLRGPREFGVFRGRGVSVLPQGGSEWLGGVMGEVSDEGFSLERGGESRFFAFTDIQKAKLDSQEDV
jgi:ribosome maturation factor RimP